MTHGDVPGISCFDLDIDLLDCRRVGFEMFRAGILIVFFFNDRRTRCFWSGFLHFLERWIDLIALNFLCFIGSVLIMRRFVENFFG